VGCVFVVGLEEGFFFVGGESCFVEFVSVLKNASILVLYLKYVTVMSRRIISIIKTLITFGKNLYFPFVQVGIFP